MLCRHRADLLGVEAAQFGRDESSVGQYVVHVVRATGAQVPEHGHLHTYIHTYIHS